MKNNLKKPELIGQPMRENFLIHCEVGIEDGKSVLYVVQTGRPPVFNVVDINTGKLLRSFELSAKSSNCWSHKADGRGNIYFATQGDSRLYRYSTITKKVEELSDVGGSVACYNLCFDDDANVYLGTFPGARIIKYDVKTKESTDLGEAIKGEKYAITLVYHNGWIYAGGYSAATSFVKMNIKTGEVVILNMPKCDGAYTEAEIRSVYKVTKVDHYIFANLIVADGSTHMHIFDLITEQWMPFSLGKSCGHYVTQPLDGKVYYVSDGEFASFDLETFDIQRTGIKYDTFLMGGGWVHMEDQDKYPGFTYVHVHYDLGKIAYMNLQTKTASVIESEIQPQPIEIRGMVFDCNNRLIIGGFMGSHGAMFEKGWVKYFNIGQIEGATKLGDKVYLGVYPGARIYELDTLKEFDKNNPRFLFSVGESQDRPFRMIEAEGKLIISTIPVYGEHGGALTIYDPETEEVSVYRNIIENQSIISLAYKDGVIYGSSGIWGGLGIDPIEKDAKLFIFDLKTRTVIREKHMIIEELGHLMHIGDIAFGNDGLLWCIAKGSIIAVCPVTFEVIKYKHITGKLFQGIKHHWLPYSLRFGKDGLIYMNPDYTPVVLDPSTMEHKLFDCNIEYEAEHFEVDDNGVIYYSDFSKLYRINTKEL